MMNAVTNILRGLLKMVLGIVKVIWKIIHVMLVFMFSVVCGTTKSNKWQYDAEYYGYE